jgi:hypothetical protein
MGISKLISIATTLALLAVASGRLPTVITHVRKAQLELLKNSKASSWPQAMTLQSHRKKP